MKKYTLLTLLAALLLTAVLPAAAQDAPPTPGELCAAATPAETPDVLTFAAAEDVLTEGVDYLAVFCTTAGPILIDLFEAQTPVTVNSFVFLARVGYYNNTNFHRVIAGFMAQGGDPTNTGGGGPGYQFEDEIVDGLIFDRPGLLAMANAGEDTNGSQFFITTAPADWLNGKHTIFGEVLAGQGNVERIRLRDPQQALEPGTLLETVVIVEGAENVAVVEETLTPAGRPEAEAALEQVNAYIPIQLDRLGAPFGETLSASFAYDAAASGIFDTAGLIETVEGVQMDAQTYYSAHNHAYSLRAIYTNPDCNLATFPIPGFSYQLDAYATAEDAAAALADGALADLLAAQGFSPYTEIELPYTVYTRTQQDCGTDMVAARAYLQQGRFVTMQEVIVTAENAEIAAFLPEALALPLFEDAFNSLLRPEALNPGAG